MNKKINKNLLEFNKPSELCQVVYFKNNKNLITTLTATQIDLLNLIFYKIRENIIKEKKEIIEFYPLEIDLIFLSSMLKSYKHSDYKCLIKQLIDLSDIRVVINALKKNKELETTLTRFIHKISISRHKNKKNKKVRIVVDGEICEMLVDIKKLFTKMFLSIQLNLNSKYSKLLYELLKDYSGIKEKTIDYEMLIALLNVDFENTKNGMWAFFNQNILKKAVKEINEKSDIIVDYEPIKEKPSPSERKRVTKIKFNIRPQPKSKLEKLGIINQKPNYDIALYNKSKSKLDKLIKNGYDVIDEEMWIETDINKNKELYEAQIKLDDYFKQLDKLDSSDKFDLMHELAIFLNSSDPIVTFDKEKYLIVDVSGNLLTTSAKETREKILEFQENSNKG